MKGGSAGDGYKLIVSVDYVDNNLVSGDGFRSAGTITGNIEKEPVKLGPTTTSTTTTTAPTTTTTLLTTTTTTPSTTTTTVVTTTTTTTVCSVDTQCALCQKCVSGFCVDQALGEDLKGECPGAFGTCAGANCNGAGACQYLAAGQQGCGTCQYCTGSSFSCAVASSGWIELGSPAGSYAHVLAEYNGFLYKGIGSGSAYGKVYRYENGGWADTGQLGSNWDVYALAVWNGNLYGGANNGVYRYTGTGWVSTNLNAHVSALAVWNGYLYAGSGSGYVYRYDGATWVDTGRASGQFTEALAVFNGKLYEGGCCTGKVCRYDNPTWTSVGNVRPPYCTVKALVAFNGYLYASIGSQMYRYTGSGWEDKGAVGSLNRVRRFAVWKGSLYAGGCCVGKVYKYNGAGWTDLGQIGSASDVYSLLVYNNYLHVTTNLDHVYVYCGV